MIKSLREIIPQMSTDQHAHTVLLTLLAVVDDTVLVSRTLQSQLQGSWSDVVRNKWGRRVVLFLCREDDKDVLVREVREKSLGTSKKDVGVRRRELLEALSEEVLGAVVWEAGMMMKDPQASQVVQEILLFAREKGDVVTQPTQVQPQKSAVVKEGTEARFAV
jgi:pumilio homology domain family member 6